MGMRSEYKNTSITKMNVRSVGKQKYVQNKQGVIMKNTERRRMKAKATDNVWFLQRLGLIHSHPCRKPQRREYNREREREWIYWLLFALLMCKKFYLWHTKQFFICFWNRRNEKEAHWRPYYNYKRGNRNIWNYLKEGA